MINCMTLGARVWPAKTGKKKEKCNGLFFQTPKWRWEDIVDEEQTFNIKLFNEETLHPSKRTGQNITNPQTGLRLGKSHDNLFFGAIFFCIKLSCPLKKKISDYLWQKLLTFFAHRKMSPLSVVLVKTSSIGWHLSLPFVNQDSHWHFFKAGRWEEMHSILANRPSSALLCNQLVIRPPSFIRCVQRWLFLSKLWLVVCSQVSCISRCGSLLLFFVLLDWPPTWLHGISFCVKNLFVPLIEALNTIRHSSSLLWLCQVSTHSYVTVTHMPRNWKIVLLENNWQMSARWSSQPAFVTPYCCPAHPSFALNGYQNHLTQKHISDCKNAS